MSDSVKYVTTAELKAAVDERPTRWEVRFLVLAGFIGAQVVSVILPATEIAQAAIDLFHH